MKNTKKIILFYMSMFSLTAVLLYFLLPTILNYPPLSVDTDLQIAVDGVTYTPQFVVLTVICFSASLIMLFKNVGKINKLMKKIPKDDKNKQKYFNDITKICVRTPIILYITQILIPTIFMPLIIFMTGAKPVVVLKISSVFIIFFSLASAMTYVFAQTQFKKIIQHMYIENKGYDNNILNFKPQISIKIKILLELIPLIIVSLLFTSLFANTMNSKNTGNVVYEFYDVELNNFFKDKEYNDLSELKEDLYKLTVGGNIIDKFIIKENEEYFTVKNTELSDFFVKYALEYENINNRVYDYYCIDQEGTFVKIKANDGNNYLVGVIYKTSSDLFLVELLTSFIILLVLIFITLYYLANSLGKDIKLIIDGLETIIKKKDLSSNLVVVSNDETGELTNSFNRIQQLTQENIKELSEKQDIIVRQENMTILGEIAGGMAHDINNPASAINMSIDVLYSIDDKEEQKKILDNMKECTKRILAIVSSVRDQFRNQDIKHIEEFTISDVLKNIEIVMRNQLQHNSCSLNIDFTTDFKVCGEKNKLNQVLSNVIMNAILAYKENNKKGIVSVSLDNSDEKYNTIQVIDEAGGIPEDIREKLFTKILTTRGMQGTGLGLYLAKTIIEDDFGGKIYFETQENLGTTFYIKLKKVEE